jgi:predicted GNAT superfamily acetyltransferase
MPTVRELEEGETALAARALLELRPWIDSVEALVTAIDRVQRPAGYRLIGSFDDGEDDAAAVAGFRVQQNLASGRHLYVDDLVTAQDRRGRGHADALFTWLFDEARRQDCPQLHLDSAVSADRADAHRFYFRHGLRIASYHFARGL